MGDVPLAIVVVIVMKGVDLLWSLLIGGKNKQDEKTKELEESFGRDIRAVEERFSREHEKLEQKVDRMFGEINAKLEVIKTAIDKGSGMERPVAVCRAYIDRHDEAINQKLDSIKDHVWKE